MKFVVSSATLLNHLQAISRVINSKNTLPILDCFLLDLKNSTLTLTAADSETRLETLVEVNSTEGEGSAVDHAGLCRNDPVESDRFHGEGGHPSDHYLCALHRGRYHFRRRKACGDPDRLLRCDG